jgi:hypothetical protein
MKIAEIRQKYPQYSDMSDMDLARSLHGKHYQDMEFGTFAREIGMFDEAPVDPTEGMSAFERGRAGWGKSIVDLGRGVGQLVGLVDKGDVQSSRERDAPLMATTAGKVGNFGGAVSTALPAAFIPGANTVAGASAVGAGLGLMQPATSLGERAANVGLGGALGGGGVAAARGGASLYKGGKAILEPFTRGGQERIASRTLQAFAGGSEQAAKAAQNVDDALLGQGLGIKPILEGVEPTTAELAKNPGIAQLERTLRNNPEYLTAFSDRSMANKDAMMGALDSIAGSPAQMTAAKTARSGATSSLYESAGQQLVKPDSELVTLLQRPSMKKAWEVAADLAAENGDALPPVRDLLDQGINPSSVDIDGKTLHYLKMAMDDLSDNPVVHGIAGNQARAVSSTKNQLVEWIGKNIPDYDQARTTYASMSQPINQMEVGTAFRNKLQPALADFGASSRSRGAMYAEALRDGDDFAARTLGRSSARLSNIMKPEQMSKLQMVAEQLGRRTNADELGRAVGSNTGQNLVSQNILRQLLGPLGLPESTIQRAAESTLLQSVMRPAQFVGQLGEQRVMQTLARAALDPKVAAEMLKVGIDPKSIGLLLRNQQVIAPALVSGTDSARQ